MERRVGEKKRDGSGRTVDWVLGKRNGLVNGLRDSGVGGGSGCEGDGDLGGGVVGGL